MSKYYESEKVQSYLYLHCNQLRGAWEVKTRHGHELVFEGTLPECENYIKEEEIMEFGNLPFF